MTPADGYVGLTQRNAWQVAAAIYAVLAGGALIETLAGLLNNALVDSNVVIAVCVVNLLMAGLFWRLSSLPVDDRFLNIVPIVGYASLAAVLHQAPAMEPHLGVVYLCPLIFAALFLNARSLAFYIALSIAFITYSTALHADEPFGVVPGVLITAALVASASLTMYVRLQLDRIGRQAAYLSGRDALTGLANLRPLYERVDVLAKRAERGTGAVSVVMLDLDGFKRVNDHYSHSTGDATLRAVAESLLTSVRRDEMVARRGGDEFAIVTESQDEDEIAALIERVSTGVSTTRAELLPDMPTGVTAGYATYREGDTVGQLMARADRRLHEAKAEARHQRWSWRSDEGEE